MGTDLAPMDLPGPVVERRAVPRSTGRVALCGAAVVMILGAIPYTSNLVLTLLALGFPVVLVVALHRNRPAVSWPWKLIGLSFVLFTVGHAVGLVDHTLGNLTATRSLLPDLLILPGYPIFVAGLLGFLVSRTPNRQQIVGVLLDAGIAGVAMFALMLHYVVEKILVHKSAVLAVRFILVCYPSMSLFLFVITIQLAFGMRGKRSASEKLLMLAMAGVFSGDVVYMLAELHFVSTTASYLNVPYVFGYLAGWGCVLHPAMRGLTEPTAQRRSQWSAERIVLIGVAFVVPAILVLIPLSTRFSERTILFGLVIGLMGMAIVQILQAMHSVERSEAELSYQASHDSLTGLPNRSFLNHFLREQLTEAHDGGTKLGLLSLDLDRFKLINDTLGHSQGDLVLRAVAARIRGAVREGSFIARTGGDEFVIVLENPTTLASAHQAANAIRAALQVPFLIGGSEYKMTSSIGLAMSRADSSGSDADALLREADTAMYQAKEAGRDTVAVFDDSMHAQLTERVELERDLRHAVRNGEFYLAYQPVVSMSAGRVASVEALVRWAHPTLGVLLPGRFIRLAEQSDLIVEIGNWVLDEALRNLAVWRSEPGFEHLSVAVNVSALQLKDDLLVQRASRALAAYGLPGNALCLELTESEMMQDHATAVAAINSLRRLGIRFAVDDFGTEYSSFSYLQQLPVDVLKIDRSFVEGVQQKDSPAESLVAAIVALAGALHIETVAEGVETVEQSNRLVALDCDHLQGYLFARPVRGDQLPDVMRLLNSSGLAVGRAEQSPEQLAETLRGHLQPVASGQ